MDRQFVNNVDLAIPLSQLMGRRRVRRVPQENSRRRKGLRMARVKTARVEVILQLLDGQDFNVSNAHQDKHPINLMDPPHVRRALRATHVLQGPRYQV